MLTSRTPKPTSSASTAGSDAISPQIDSGHLCWRARRGSQRDAAAAAPAARARTSPATRARLSDRRPAGTAIRSLVPMREEVGLRREQVGGQRRGGHFDHRAKRHPRRLHAFLPQRRARLIERRLCRTHFLHCRHERQQDAHGASRGSAQYRAELRAQDLGPGEPETDAAHAERAMAVDVRLGLRVAQRVGLRRVDVECADRDGRRRHGRHHAAVRGRLRGFARRPGQARNAVTAQQELGSEQADAFGARPARGSHVLEAVEVGLEPDAHAISRWPRGGRPAPARRPGRPCAPPRAVAVPPARRRSGRR